MSGRWKRRSMSHKPERVVVDPQFIVRIVGDGAIAGQAVEGYSVPVLILDTTSRPDITEMIRVHGILPSGDVGYQWGVFDGDVMLALDFQRPIAAKAYIPFNVLAQGILVDGILNARAVYLQAGRPGDRIKDDFDAPRIIVQIDETGFKEQWDRILVAALRGQFRERGLGRKEVQLAVAERLAELRSISNFRFTV